MLHPPITTTTALNARPSRHIVGHAKRRLLPRVYRDEDVSERKLKSHSFIGCWRVSGAADALYQTRVPGHSSMMSKNQIIENIQQINRSARQEWLNLFDISALRRYLDHLQRTLEPRGGHSVWVRTNETAAVVTRRPA